MIFNAHLGINSVEDPGGKLAMSLSRSCKEMLSKRLFYT